MILKYNQNLIQNSDSIDNLLYFCEKIAESDLVFTFERGLLPIGLAQYVPTLQKLSYHYPNNGLLTNVGTYLAISYLLIDIFNPIICIFSTSQIVWLPNLA